MHANIDCSRRSTCSTIWNAETFVDDAQERRFVATTSNGYRHRDERRLPEPEPASSMSGVASVRPEGTRSSVAHGTSSVDIGTVVVSYYGVRFTPSSVTAVAN